MRNTTLGDLHLFLRYLFGEGLDVLRASETGRLYEPRLRAKKDAITALPEAALSRAPYADELSAEDVVHDGVGTAVFHVCEAIQAHPKLPAELKQTATMVRGIFIGSLGELRRSYADEAATALDNRPKLLENAASLKAVQVPGGGSLFDWIRMFLDSGDALDALLRKRAAALATAEDASGTGALRGSTIGLLTRFREALRDELSDPGTKLPADHEVRLFAYLDKLSADRTAALARRGSAPAAPDASAVPDAPATPAAPEPLAPNASPAGSADSTPPAPPSAPTG